METIRLHYTAYHVIIVLKVRPSRKLNRLTICICIMALWLLTVWRPTNYRIVSGRGKTLRLQRCTDKQHYFIQPTIDDERWLIVCGRMI